jgi:hypothetical protein
VRLHPSALDDTIGLAIQPLAKRNAILIAIPERFVERDIGDPGSSAYAMTKAPSPNWCAAPPTTLRSDTSRSATSSPDQSPPT